MTPLEQAYDNKVRETQHMAKRIAELEQNLRLADAVKQDLERLIFNLQKRIDAAREALR